MIKLQLAYTSNQDELPPIETKGRDYFLADALDGSDYFNKRALLSGWQEGVALFVSRR